jgi:hypothetical protein
MGGLIVCGGDATFAAGLAEALRCGCLLVCVSLLSAAGSTPRCCCCYGTSVASNPHPHYCPAGDALEEATATASLPAARLDQVSG